MTDKKVLFVDDSPTMRRIIQNSLEEIGFDDIVGAEHGVEAMTKLKDEGDIELILTDWNMPEMDGEEFVKEVKDSDTFSDIPILMITTRGMKDDVITAVKMGVDGYIVKPFDAETLQSKINKAIS